MHIDELDRSILAVLTVEGRVKWSALAERFGVSAPAIADRVRRLEKAGVLLGYAAKLNPEVLGFGLTAFVTVTLEHPRYRQGFVAYVQANNRVQACHHIVGEGDYLLKICCRSTSELEQLLSEELKALPGIVQTRTTISLRSIKDTAAVPIEAEEG
ncbi:transcriptional regulator, AsnC family [Synechococcus sp. PCC 7335]|uniref:Lrp/AsnC family transcriptional regulator n=1 Tax=Synechococcus sp. (strain ATCC 29403 / PCC 7335) TaxID=91464 RepID=UPI00017ED573|nr:Lrp/AsnC family transcriptional regulator [Synechococcus sp. PCC 7335]EDX84814.1 transcriptional regulator, AsnC family [Synechococcus sp. PCC 7335]